MRGSGRFSKTSQFNESENGCLNPLHCGAVVASIRARQRQPPSGDRLNPLHCGAVVASKESNEDKARACLSQSPSLRGSGRFEARGIAYAAYLDGLNPLHCGAVVASPQPRRRRRDETKSHNPLHCGAVVASAMLAVWRAWQAEVSIPFIAGQWSLPSRSPTGGPGMTRLNPLHCGAVVASKSAEDEAALREACLNPLHCGAVVASTRPCGPPLPPPAVSQSPSLRGSGRFMGVPGLRRPQQEGLNPLHCGAVVASRRHFYPVMRLFLSQSPSLRGSGRFMA